MLGGLLTLEGSPIWWAAIHRAHHRHVDTPLDPHSPKDGMGHAYFGWMLENEYPSHVDPQTQCKDLLSDPFYRFLEQGGNLKRAHALNFAIGITFRVLLFAFFGWQVALANILATVMVFQVPLLLNLFCHIPKLGYKNFATEDDSVNVWWVAILAMGEGWHNNHHAFPGSARSGLKLHEFDLSWQTIKLFKSLGLIGWINEAKPPYGHMFKPLPVTITDPEPVGKKVLETASRS
jgi:stearoyl-CoA desaturase (delta-9 desaturase)